MTGGPTTVYIAGPGHSGSTVFDRALGGHSLIASLGEVHRLSLTAGREDAPMRCSCGLPVGQCTFWVQVGKELGAASGTRTDVDTTFAALTTTDPRWGSLRGDGVYLGAGEEGAQAVNCGRLLALLGSKRVLRAAGKIFPSAKLARRIGVDSHRVFEAVRRAHGVRVVVDSTKNPARLKWLLMERPDDTEMRVLYIVRDGRAVCASRMRREGVTMAAAVARWKREWHHHLLARVTIPSRLVREVRYETFADDPAAVLADVCSWLGLDFQPAMSNLLAREHHGIGGNPVRFERNRLATVQLDERWRTELSVEDLRVFASTGRSLNIRLGYSS